MPGSIGGDLVKAIYIVKSYPLFGKTPIITSLIVDRAIGLGALVILCAAILLANDELFDSLNLNTLFFLIAAAVALCANVGETPF
jgi:hypothetical protein